VLTGRRARQVLFLVLLLSTAERVTPALAAGIIREHLRLTSSEFGILAGMSAFGFGLSQFPGGYLADIHGALRMVRYAALASAGSALLFLLAPNYPIALLGRAGFGISDSLVFIGMMRLAVDNRGGGAFEFGKIQAAVGLAFAGAAIAGLGLSATSFPLVFGTLALVQVGLTLSVKAPPPDGAERPHGPGFREILQIGTSRQFWASVLVTTGVFAPFLAWTSGWALPYLQSEVGLSADQARIVIVVNALVAAASALFLGRISDILGRRLPVMIIGTTTMTAAWTLLFLSPSPTSVAVAVVLTSLACASFPASSSSLALAKESFRRDRAGAVLGLANVTSSIGAALLGAAVGLELDTQWQGAVSHGLRVYPLAAYRLVPLVLGAGSLVAVIGLLLARETHAQQVPAPG
jgi:MFS family permease